MAREDGRRLGRYGVIEDRDANATVKWFQRMVSRSSAGLEEALGWSCALDFGGLSAPVEIVEASGVRHGCCPTERSG